MSHPNKPQSDPTPLPSSTHMLARGSLKKCIECLIFQYHHYGQKMLSIVHVPRGKYYQVLTEEQLVDYNSKPKSNDMRLCFRGSARELEQFARLVPPDIFDGLETNEGT